MNPASSPTEAAHGVAVPPEQFRKGMRYLAGACSIIACGNDDERAGLTATAVMSVTADPPRLLVCVNKNVRAHELIGRHRALSVNVLSDAQEPLARRFAGMVPGVMGEARFEGGPWHAGATGVPVLADALASFECRVVEAISASTHDLFVCEVIDITTQADCGPLVYFDGLFARVAAVA